MPQSPTDRVTAQLMNIKGVADDLSRELLRAQCHPTSVVHEMTMFIKTEAEAALSVLSGDRPSSGALGD
jgi:hypothetical protein